MIQMKEHIKISEKELKQNRDKTSIRWRVQNTSYKVAQEIQWGLQQHKTDPVRNKEFTNWNKEQLQENNSRVD